MKYTELSLTLETDAINEKLQHLIDRIEQKDKLDAQVLLQLQE